jgi:hypothetical protein
MRRGYFTDMLSNLVRLGMNKDGSLPKEFFLLGHYNDIDRDKCVVELSDNVVEEVKRVGFTFNEQK